MGMLDDENRFTGMTAVRPLHRLIEAAYGDIKDRVENG
jgi:hypothetical protein